MMNRLTFAGLPGYLSVHSRLHLDEFTLQKITKPRKIISNRYIL